MPIMGGIYAIADDINIFRNTNANVQGLIKS